ncbi:adenylosuccinate lyase [Clostridium acetobutylicum]|uniref:Adenylosuccinate lyase n=1 Tax=Clostridium acetobutylicum (strain ATCC 824 / DSM 792 / JCM 1419 / IAM 19013 / LMG 5710 / NBRC 13948 / NRRL B-527 / VKM B-1787 / 2291 / W) TaxID=272562 RepID=Q97I33_CLOAB|nr:MULTISPECIES: adenylosuccinate lyase [Clostridium]AAK79786.1 Adenylosuccinate lyase [Clostridium acetobutylicum ATCC 824]ADZ20871.1 adenylosuccinate lyase [Clostridium acetobutylicum EA 2018]AEI33693.1 adenylosuccinate lyase [Clostridium acetobutylicum DSM 1731]AWV79779.1 adenylosuccinate lyase [Clostridium acetobutylicum]MBC2394239.1 adenylosuccinate lyase [Clostridium acetobutylicum]
MRNTYETPLNTRYASKEMSYLFSDDMKFRTWRKLWVALAESEMELGLNITNEQINELKAHIDDINYDVAQEREKIVRHDVMSHVYAYGVQCPSAKGIIHLGATSCYVGDNADIIIMKEALILIRKKLLNTIHHLSKFALNYKSLPTLGFTHLQPAQLTTVGKRATLWIQDLMIDLENLDFVIENLKLRGVKGTTGTQASFMDLFNGDQEKIKTLEKKVVEKMNFKSAYDVTGQTYPRKIDSIVLNTLSEIAQSAYKFSNDLRILQNMKEMEEPFEKNQIGSSAMAYKRNPMRSERISALSRYIIVNSLNPAITAATQWFERTLDDSANKRISVAEAFLALDGVLNLYINVSSNMVVYENVITAHVKSELPFMATENIMMEAVKKGCDRQELHERIRKHSMETAKRIKADGLPNDLIERIKKDSYFKLTEKEIDEIIDPNKFVGRAPYQVEEYIINCVKPILVKNKDIVGIEVSIDV